MTEPTRRDKYPVLDTFTVTLLEIAEALEDKQRVAIARGEDEADVFDTYAQTLSVLADALSVCIECLHPTVDNTHGHGGGVGRRCALINCACPN